MTQRPGPSPLLSPFSSTEDRLGVLVVDDSAPQRKLLALTLRRWGFDTREADSAEAALECCDQRVPDMIVSDWMMPGMTGIDFCRAYHARYQDSFAYFILLTAKSEKAEVALGLESGADDFLIKPVDTNELRARITAGARIVRMQRALEDKNREVNEALAEIRRLYDLLDRDLMEARKLQQSLLPEREKVFDTGALALLLRSAGHVGGDLVGFFPSDDGKLGLFAIDVSGHGISSALITARLASLFSNTTREQNIALHRRPDGRFVARPPAEVVAQLNALLVNEVETEHYLTLILAFVTLQTGEVQLCQAGHPHPMVRRMDGSIDVIGEGGFPVGLLEELRFEAVDFRLAPGDRLMFLSDGVTECTAAQSEEMLEEAGVRAMLQRIGHMPGPRLLESLVWELSRFAGTEEFSDDVSGLVFDYTGPEAPM